MQAFLVLLLATLGRADKLDRIYLPPPNNNYAEGYPGDIEAPFESSKQSQSFDRKFPENNLRDLGTNEIITEQDSPNPNVSLGNDASSFIVPSTTEQMNGQAYSLSPADRDQINNFRDKYPQIDDGNSNNRLPSDFRKPSFNTAYNNPSTSSQASVNIPRQQNILRNMEQNTSPLQPGSIIPGTNQQSSNSFRDNFSPIVTVTENPNGYSESPIFEKDYQQPSFSDSEKSRVPSKSGLQGTYEQKYPERVQAAADRNAVILNYDNVINPDSYAYSFDTSNRIHGDENGTTIDGTKAKGSYSYIGDDGKNYTVHYTADENGFQPQGDHLPTPPPVPEAIKKAIEQIAEDERNGIFDDGSYDDRKYGYKNYQNQLPIGNKLNGDKFKNIGNSQRGGVNNLGLTRGYQTPSQNVQSIASSPTGESFVDNYNKDYDSNIDNQGNVNDFKRYMKPINTNKQDNNKLGRPQNNQIIQNPAYNNLQAEYIRSNNLPGDINNFYGTSIDQNSNSPTDNINPKELNNFKNVQNLGPYSTTATLPDYQYSTPQVMYTTQATVLPTGYTQYDGQFSPVPHFPISQAVVNSNQSPLQKYQSFPGSNLRSPIIPSKFLINYNEKGDTFGNKPANIVDQIQSLPDQGNSLILQQGTGPDRANTLIPVTNSDYIYPKGNLQVAQERNNLPSQNPTYANQYTTTTPMPSRYSTYSKVDKPQEDNRTPGTIKDYSNYVYPKGNLQVDQERINLPSQNPSYSNQYPTSTPMSSQFSTYSKVDQPLEDNRTPGTIEDYSNYVYPKGNLQVDQERNNLPSQNPSYSNQYPTTTPMSSQFSTYSIVDQPREDNRTPGTIIDYSTAATPSLFTNGPGRTSTVNGNIVPTFGDKINKDYAINGYPLENISKKTGVTYTGRPEDITNNYSEPEFIPSTSRFETPGGTFSENYQPTYGDIYKLRPNIKGEDFSGPKQLQRYDPATGYHYK